MAKKEKINRRVEYRLRDRSDMTGCHKCGAQEIVADIIIRDTRVFPPEEELRPLCNRCYDIYYGDLERMVDNAQAVRDLPGTKPQGSVKNHAEIILTPIVDPSEMEMLEKKRAAQESTADDVKTRRQSSRGNRACRGSSGGRAAD